MNVIEAAAAVIGRNNVTMFGRDDGPVMMFAHGFGCDQAMWRKLLPYFVDDYRLVLFDHVGAGHSDISACDWEKYGTLDGYASDLLEICAALGLENVILVGHSVSTMIAMIAAVQDPDRFSHLVLLAPSPRHTDDPYDGYVGGFSREDIEGLLASLDSNYFAWAAAVAPMVMGNQQEPELAEDLRVSFCRTDPSIARPAHPRSTYGWVFPQGLTSCFPYRRHRRIRTFPHQRAPEGRDPPGHGALRLQGTGTPICRNRYVGTGCRTGRARRNQFRTPSLPQ